MHSGPIEGCRVAGVQISGSGNPVCQPPVGDIFGSCLEEGNESEVN